VEYHSWSLGRSVSPGYGYATLKDNFGNAYKQSIFGLGTILHGAAGSYEAIHPTQKEVPKRKDGMPQGADILVFEPPIDTAVYLDLEMPAKNIGGEEVIRFRIPMKSVKGTSAQREDAAQKKQEEDYAKLIATADAELAAKRFRSAKDLYNQAGKLFPGDSKAIEGLSKVEDEEKKFQKAEYARLMAQGRIAIPFENYDAAVKAFTEALNVMNGVDAEASKALNAALEARGKKREAESIAQLKARKEQEAQADADRKLRDEARRKAEKEAMEDKAKLYLENARRIINRGDTYKGMIRLRELIEEYPNTVAGKEAKKLLDKLEK
jgi:hypothetical protein